MFQSIPLRTGLCILCSGNQLRVSMPSKGRIPEREEGPPKTMYRPAALSYRTLGSGGTRAEMRADGKAAVSKQSASLVLERCMYHSDRGRTGINTGITFSGKLIGLRITKLAYPQKAPGWE